MLRRNNTEILDLPEEEGKKTWVNTEELMKKTIKEQVHYENVHTEQAHCVGKPQPLLKMNSDGTKTKNHPRPIIMIFSSWKKKKAILAMAKKV